MRADSVCVATGTDVYLKLESEQPTGSFKVRGAIYALASHMARDTVTHVVYMPTNQS